MDQACCSKCNEQYPLPTWSFLPRKIRRDVTCPKCTENQRKCNLLTGQKELEKEKNEHKRLEIQLEREKTTNLYQQQQHDQVEGENRRRHETIMQDKRNEEKRIVLNIKQQQIKGEQLELEKKAEQHKHELEMQERRCTENQRKCDLLTHEKELQKEKNEEKRIKLQLEEANRATLLAVETKRSETIIAKAKIKEENDYKKLQHKAAMQAKQHKHELEIQDRRLKMECERNEGKRIEVERISVQTEQTRHETERLEQLERVLELQLRLTESSGPGVNPRNFEKEHFRYPIPVEINDSN